AADVEGSLRFDAGAEGGFGVVAKGLQSGGGLVALAGVRRTEDGDEFAKLVGGWGLRGRKGFAEEGDGVLPRVGEVPAGAVGGGGGGGEGVRGGAEVGVGRPFALAARGVPVQDGRVAAAGEKRTAVRAEDELHDAAMMAAQREQPLAAGEIEQVNRAAAFLFADGQDPAVRREGQLHADMIEGDGAHLLAFADVEDAEGAVPEGDGARLAVVTAPYHTATPLTA